MYVCVLLGVGYFIVLIDVDIKLFYDWNDCSLDVYICEDVLYGVYLVFINLDYLQVLLDQIGEVCLVGKYIIVCWFWELENILIFWLLVFELVDEILVVLQYVGDVFVRVIDKLILCVLLLLSDVGDSGLQWVDFGIDVCVFVFMMLFDFNFFVYCKNLFVVICVFQCVFFDCDCNVQLLIKISNGYCNFECFKLLLDSIGEDVCIVVCDYVLDWVDVQVLQCCVDVYVLLYYVEGFGFGLVECMVQGKLVIGMVWLGNMEFMDVDNSVLVGYMLVLVEEGEYVYYEGQCWVVVDEGQVVDWMCWLVDEFGLVDVIGVCVCVLVFQMLFFECVVVVFIVCLSVINGIFQMLCNVMVIMMLFQGSLY